MRSALLLCSLTISGWQCHSQDALNAADGELKFSDGKLSANFRRAPLASIAARIGTLTHVTISVPEALGAVEISAEVNGVAIDEALRRVFAGFDLFFFYDARTSPARLRTAWLYPKGSAAMLRPVPPQEWASSKELDQLFRDSDPAVRWTAYEALLSRPDAQSRRVITEALRGGETDAGVRERLVSEALGRGFDVPAEVVGDLARADLSDRIRLIALDAIAQFPNAKNVAEGALTDSSEAVRLRAKEILREVTGHERRRVPVDESAATDPQ